MIEASFIKSWESTGEQANDKNAFDQPRLLLD